jgi:hypothetical protein
MTVYFMADDKGGISDEDFHGGDGNGNMPFPERRTELRCRCRARAQNQHAAGEQPTSCKSTKLTFCNTSTHTSTQKSCTYRSYSSAPPYVLQAGCRIPEYDFRLKWGSNESIMGTRFLSVSQLLSADHLSGGHCPAIVHGTGLLPIWHRSTLSTHPLRKCVSTLRLSQVGIRLFVRAVCKPEKDLKPKEPVGVSTRISCARKRAA